MRFGREYDPAPECFDPYRKEIFRKQELEEKPEINLERIILGCGGGCLTMIVGAGFVVYGIYKLVF